MEFIGEKVCDVIYRAVCGAMFVATLIVVVPIASGIAVAAVAVGHVVSLFA